VTDDERRERYAEVSAEIAAVVGGESSRVARYATAASVLAAAFGPRFFWTGFYLVDPDAPDELVVGPYQGSLGCLRIAFGKGVCGAAAARRETMRVDDVHAFSGHIACDARTNSEIVVPVFDGDGALVAVLDVDSTDHGAFDDIDQHGLEQAMAQLLTA